MRFFVLLLVLVLTSCATSIQTSARNGQENAPILKVQSLSLTPKNGGQLITQEILKPGDILLTADNGYQSVGVRVMTVAPVSHAALYIGDGRIVEAVGTGVREITVDYAVNHDSVIAVFRHPELREAHYPPLTSFVLDKVGRSYNYLGIVLQAPFSIQRRMCEMPFLTAEARDFCLKRMASLQMGTFDDNTFFCSQLILEAFNHVGVPITSAHPRWISPADLMHMREGDVPSIRANQPLIYVGHLK